MRRYHPSAPPGRMQITLEGHDAPISANAGDALLQSLLQAGLPFPFSCQAGNCGTCKCRLLSGEVIELEYSAHVLRAGERAEGVILACRAQLRSDVTIRRLD